jgi:hypothetical protein
VLTLVYPLLYNERASILTLPVFVDKLISPDPLEFIFSVILSFTPSDIIDILPTFELLNLR